MSLTRTILGLTLLSSLLLIGCQPPPPAEAPSVSLSVVSEPAGAQVYVDGKLAGTTPLDTTTSTGQHMVELRLTGHESYWQHLPASETSGHKIKATLPKITATVQILTTPPGALVELDGESVGETPLVLWTVPVGNHEIDMALTGFAPKKAIVDVVDSRPVQLAFELESTQASLKVFTSPPGSDVYLGDNLQGTTPDDASKPLFIDGIAAGEYPVTVSKPGFKEITQQVTLRRNEVKTLRFPAMNELPGSLRVSSQPAGAKVFNDQEILLGTTPATLVDLPNGEVRLRIIKPGYSPETRTITVSRGLTKQIDIILRSNTGAVTFQTEPPGCKVHIDGRYHSTSERSAAPQVSEVITISGLAPGPHRIDLIHPECEAFHRTFNVQRDQTTRLGTLMPKVRWLPTHQLTTSTGPVYQGILINTYDDGSILFERAPNIRVTYKAAEVAKVVTIRIEQ